MTEARAPIFVLGRQHCGNTMLATMLGRHPEVYAFTGEGNFFEHIDSIRAEAYEARRDQVVHEIVHGADPVLGDDLQETLRTHLRDETERRGAVGLYAEGKAALTRRNGAERWVQKATSYVFHVERILEVFPAARLLFLARNPLDLAASVHRRGHFENQIARTVWGWNAGLRQALDWADNQPSNVRVCRYENVVQRPKEKLKEITDFCGLSFSSDCLDIPHVNPSENHTPKQTRLAAQIRRESSTIPTCSRSGMKWLSARSWITNCWSHSIRISHRRVAHTDGKANGEPES
jgi:hypothetical protein